MNRLLYRFADLFTLRYRSRSEFDSDYEFRYYYAEEHARVTINYMLAALVLGVGAGVLTMWVVVVGGA